VFGCILKKCFEKYFLMFGCVAENNIENTFSSSFSHFLTFSQLPNKYIIPFLSRQTQKQNPIKKNSSNPVKFIETQPFLNCDRCRLGAIAPIRPGSKGRGRSRKREIGGANSTAQSCRCVWGWGVVCESFFLSLFLSQAVSVSPSFSLSLSLFPEVI